MAITAPAAPVAKPPPLPNMDPYKMPKTADYDPTGGKIDQVNQSLGTQILGGLSGKSNPWQQQQEAAAYRDADRAEEQQRSQLGGRGFGNAGATNAWNNGQVEAQLGNTLAGIRATTYQQAMQAAGQYGQQVTAPSQAQQRLNLDVTTGLGNLGVAQGQLGVAQGQLKLGQLTQQQQNALQQKQLEYNQAIQSGQLDLARKAQADAQLIAQGNLTLGQNTLTQETALGGRRLDLEQSLGQQQVDINRANEQRLGTSSNIANVGGIVSNANGLLSIINGGSGTVSTASPGFGGSGWTSQDDQKQQSAQAAKTGAGIGGAIGSIFGPIGTGLGSLAGSILGGIFGG